MRQMVKNTFGRPISIELLEKLVLPTSSSSAAANRLANTTTVTTATTSPSCVVVNPSLLSQTSLSTGQQPLLYTTVQPQQKINLLQATPSTPTLIGANTSLLGQQQQQQQQARAQIVRSIARSDPCVEIELCFSFSHRILVEFGRSSQRLHPRRIATCSILNLKQQRFNLLLKRLFLNPILFFNEPFSLRHRDPHKLHKLSRSILNRSKPKSRDSVNRRLSRHYNHQHSINCN